MNLNVNKKWLHQVLISSLIAIAVFASQPALLSAQSRTVQRLKQTPAADPKETIESGMRCQTNALKGLYNALKKSNPEFAKFIQTLPEEGKTAEVKINGSPYTIVAEAKVSGTITHLGLNFFSATAREAQPEITRSVERLMLLYLLEAAEDGIKMAQSDGIQMTYNGILLGNMGFESIKPAVQLIRASPEFTLQSNEHSFVLRWTKGNEVFLMTFPSRYDLVLGMDKLELDEHLGFTLKSLTPATYLPEALDPKEMQFDESRKVWVIKGRAYSEEYKSVGQFAFFTKAESGEYQLIWDKSRPEESFYNLIYGATDGKDLELTVTQSIYGGKQITYTQRLKTLLAYFNPNYRIYVGIERNSAEELPVVLFFESKQYSHLHMLSFTIPVDLFDDKVRNVNAKLSGNIRNDNVKNLYQEFQDNPGGKKIKVKKGK